MLTSKASRVIEDVPGREVNLMHYSSDTVRKSKIPTYQSTNGYFSLNQYTSASTSTVIIPPNHGLEKIVLGMQLPDSYASLSAIPVGGNSAISIGSGAYDGLALPSGWAYSMIQQVNYRIAGSADFTLSGAALRAACLMNASNSGQKQVLMSQLGGAALAGRRTSTDTSDFSVPQNRIGFVVLSLFGLSSQSGGETPCPLPTNLSNGPITITIQWADFTKVFASNAGVAPPTGMTASWVQTRQLFPVDSSDELRLSGGQKYMYPLTYYQQEIQIPLQGNSASITGIKEGQCRGLYLFFTQKSVPVNGSGVNTNPNATTFYQVEDLVLTYNGVVIHRFPGLTSAQMLDTLYSDVSGYFETKKYVASAAGTIGFSEVQNDPLAISSYYHAPFAQRFEQFSGMSDMTLMNGISLGAGSIQVQFNAIYDVDGNVISPTNTTLHIVPYLVAALSFSGTGDIEYVF